ncbi:MAG: FG-GAP repeat domain-containing protein [Gemmatimonadales bacterium]
MSDRVASVIAVAAAIALAAGGSAVARTRAYPPSPVRAVHFTEHLIDTGLTGGYQVVVADLNHDGKPDIIALASGLHELRWYENPEWHEHVIVSGIDQPINAAAWDVDGDGIPEIALAYGFSTVYAKSAGNIAILSHNGDPRDPWSSREIDRLPTSHRLRFADIDGTGKRVLVNFPLIGSRAVAPGYDDRTPLVMYRPGDWKREAIAEDSGVVHGILPYAWNGDTRESVFSGSFSGVFQLRFDRGTWTRAKILDGDPSPWPKGGASEVVVGSIGREKYLATIEPWHGNEIVVYRQSGGVWKRHVIDDTIRDGHTMVVADFDGDGQDEIIVGERSGKRSVYLYRLANAAEDRWTKEALDAGGMAAAGCAAADMNGDKRPDVVCIGTATANLKWYENMK